MAVGQGLAAGAAALGLATLAEFLLSRNLGIDCWLVQDHFAKDLQGIAGKTLQEIEGLEFQGMLDFKDDE